MGEPFRTGAEKQRNKAMTIQSEHCVACCKKFCNLSEAKM